MDHGYAATNSPHVLPPEITSTGAQIVSFLHSGGRCVVLIGGPHSGKTATLDAVLRGMPAWVERVSNRVSRPLTLARIVAQLGPDSAPVKPANAAARLFGTLSERSGTSMPAVLAVDDAHTLTPEALATLAGVPGLGGPDLPGMVLLLAGEPGLLALLRKPGVSRLRAEGVLTLRMPMAGTPPGMALDNDAPAERPARRWPLWAGAAGAAMVAVAALMLRAASPTVFVAAPVEFTAPAFASPRTVEAAPIVQTTRSLALPGLAMPGLATRDLATRALAPSPAASRTPEPARLPAAAADPPRASEPPRPSETARELPTAPVNQVAAAAPPPSPPTTPLRTEPALQHPLPTEPEPSAAELPSLAPPPPAPIQAQLRHEFDGFLNTAGRDTAHLAPAARETLFREYLKWRALAAR